MTDNQQIEDDYIILQSELECRYGPAIAQDLMDQIRKADDMSHTPDFMEIKAVSEAYESFKEETDKTLNDVYKNAPPLEHGGDGAVFDLQQKRTELICWRSLTCYWLLHQSFYKMYEKAMNAYTSPKASQEPQSASEQSEVKTHTKKVA